MDYIRQIELYLGRLFVDSECRLIDHSDGNGIQIEYWNLPEPQPTIEQLEALQPQVEAQENIEKILAQIIELDGKRSRAFFEPSEKEAGLTWLEYYNQEITKLRNKLI